MNDENPVGKVLLSRRQSRREFIRKAAYASPVLLSLPAAPSFAQQGSGSGSGPVVDNPPAGGPRPASSIDCSQPLQPIDSDVAQNMCQLSFDEDFNLFYEDIIVSQDAIPGHLAQGDLLGTCDSFLCNAS